MKDQQTIATPLRSKKKRVTTDSGDVYRKKLANGELTEGFVIARNGKPTLQISSQWDKPKHRVEIRKCLKLLFDSSVEFRNNFKTPSLDYRHAFLELRNHKLPGQNKDLPEFLKRSHETLIKLAQPEPLPDFAALFENGQLITGYHLVAKKIILKIARPYSRSENYPRINEMLKNHHANNSDLFNLFHCPKLNNDTPSLTLRDGTNLTDKKILKKIDKLLSKPPKNEKPIASTTTFSAESTNKDAEQFDLTHTDDIPELIEAFLFNYKLKRKLNPVLTTIEIEALQSLPNCIVEMLYSPDYLSESTESLITAHSQFSRKSKLS